MNWGFSEWAFSCRSWRHFRLDLELEELEELSCGEGQESGDKEGERGEKCWKYILVHIAWCIWKDLEEPEDELRKMEMEMVDMVKELECFCVNIFSGKCVNMMKGGMDLIFWEWEWLTLVQPEQHRREGEKWARSSSFSSWEWECETAVLVKYQLSLIQPGLWFIHIKQLLKKTLLSSYVRWCVS